MSPLTIPNQARINHRRRSIAQPAEPSFGLRRQGRFFRPPCAGCPSNNFSIKRNWNNCFGTFTFDYGKNFVAKHRYIGEWGMVPFTERAP